METIIGIDLGTTNSEVALLKNGSPQVIPVEGEIIMPSCVGLAPEGRLLVGRSARNQMVVAPESTVISIKRKMGTNTRVQLGEKAFSPEEISSLILGRLKQGAEDHLGASVTRAVITVPAYFDDAQRKATRDAGVLAGLEVMRIINEPTAAALAYDAGLEKNQVLLVYDLGGGTFDVSLVIVENGVVEVKATHGDTHLGGDDFDRLLMEHVAKHFREETGVDLLQEPQSRNRLWVAVEAAKRKMTDAPYARIREEYMAGDHHLDVEIDRGDYEEMIRPLVRKTLDSVHQCLKDAAMLPKAVDRVILVGGACRTPLVGKMIRDSLKVEQTHEINPDLIVAMGSAIQAGTLAGERPRSVLVDITPHTFGTRALAVHDGELRPDVFVPVIRRNTPLPVQKGEVFYTATDEQEAVDVHIYQGEAPIAGDNVFIGNFIVEGLSDVPAGNPIVLNLSLDLSGILEVTAKEKRSGLSKTVCMHTDDGKQRLDLDACRSNLSGITGDRVLTEEAGAAGKDAILSEAKRLRRRATELLEGVNEMDAAELRALIKQSGEVVATGDMEKLVELNESLSDMLFYLED
jgi:molecular chaperone DnaK